MAKRRLKPEPSLVERLRAEEVRKYDCLPSPINPDGDEAADRIEALEAKLRQIFEMGPMAVDDQRWRIARDALTSETQKASLPGAS